VRFNEQELRTLCDIHIQEVKYDDLQGEGLANKARELITYFDRRGRFQYLVEAIQTSRPDISLGDLPETSSNVVQVETRPTSPPTRESPSKKWFLTIVQSHALLVFILLCISIVLNLIAVVMLRQSRTPTATPTPTCSVEKKDGMGNTDSLELPLACNGSVIRIDLLTRGTGWGFSLREVAAYGPDVPQTDENNLLKGGTACASSMEDGNQEWYDPRFAIDGTMDRRWSSEKHEPEYLVIVLSESKPLKHFVLKWQEQEAYAIHYRVTVFNSQYRGLDVPICKDFAIIP
jgi:hypothetical protein